MALLSAFIFWKQQKIRHGSTCLKYYFIAKMPFNKQSASQRGRTQGFRRIRLFLFSYKRIKFDKQILRLVRQFNSSRSVVQFNSDNLQLSIPYSLREKDGLFWDGFQKLENFQHKTFFSGALKKLNKISVR